MNKIYSKILGWVGKIWFISEDPFYKRKILFYLKLFVAVLFTLSFDRFLGGWGGWLVRFYVEFILVTRVLLTYTTFSLDTLLLIYWDLFWFPGARFVDWGYFCVGFFSKDLSLNFYSDELIFFSGIVSKGFSFFFILTSWLFNEVFDPPEVVGGFLVF